MALPDDVESSYYQSQGFDPDHTRAVLAHYLPFVEGAELLVDLGCGRGELLELAAPKVGRTLGVDVDPAMVESVRAAGYDAVEADVVGWVRDTSERPDAVVLTHLIEHLPVDAAFDLLSGIAGVQPPDGILVVVTPNPACLANLRNDFWSDPTHVRLYTPDLLRFLVDQAGFEVVEAGGNPANHAGPPPDLTAPPIPGGDPVATARIEAPAPIQYDESFQLESILEEVARLRAATEQLVHVHAQLAGRHRELERLVGLLAGRHDGLLGDLWAPNEIYVVGRRRS